MKVHLLVERVPPLGAVPWLFAVPDRLWWGCGPPTGRWIPLDIGAARGVVGTVVRLLEGGSTHLGVATDSVIESWRNDLWPGYKTGASIDPALRDRFDVLEVFSPPSASPCGRSSSTRRTTPWVPPPRWPPPTSGSPRCRSSRRTRTSPSACGARRGAGRPAQERGAGQGRRARTLWRVCPSPSGLPRAGGRQRRRLPAWPARGQSTGRGQAPLSTHRDPRRPAGGTSRCGEAAKLATTLQAASPGPRAAVPRPGRPRHRESRRDGAGSSGANWQWRS